MKYLSLFILVVVISGCSQESAFRGVPEKVVFGCINNDAVNFETEANSNDGSCYFLAGLRPETIDLDSNSKNKIDLYMLIDNSGSMAPYQQRLASAISDFVPEISKLRGNIKFHLWTTEGEVDNSTRYTTKRFDRRESQETRISDTKTSNITRRVLKPSLLTDIPILEEGLSDAQISSISSSVVREVTNVGANTEVSRNQTFCALNRIVHSENKEVIGDNSTHAAFLTISDEIDSTVDTQCYDSFSYDRERDGFTFRIGMRILRAKLYKLVGNEEQLDQNITFDKKSDVEAVYRNTTTNGPCTSQVISLLASKGHTGFSRCKMQFNTVGKAVVSEKDNSDIFAAHKDKNICTESFEHKGRTYANAKEYFQTIFPDNSIQICNKADIITDTNRIRTEFYTQNESLSQSFVRKAKERFQDFYFQSFSYLGQASSCSLPFASLAEKTLDLSRNNNNIQVSDICLSSYADAFKEQIGSFIKRVLNFTLNFEVGDERETVNALNLIERAPPFNKRALELKKGEAKITQLGKKVTIVLDESLDLSIYKDLEVLVQEIE